MERTRTATPEKENDGLLRKKEGVAVWAIAKRTRLHGNRLCIHLTTKNLAHLDTNGIFSDLDDSASNHDIGLAGVAKQTTGVGFRRVRTPAYNE
jgi:hypothetical protein